MRQLEREQRNDCQVTSDEVEESPNGADGNTFNDIVISCNRHSVQLAAERDGNSDGRVYTITLQSQIRTDT